MDNCALGSDDGTVSPLSVQSCDTTAIAVNYDVHNKSLAPTVPSAVGEVAAEEIPSDKSGKD